ncbi:hypothetical protein EDD15DRAFT_2197289 [Pisolithus albus]|nr:hypothetical protein EDD15DRAFT_2197289 [Pisolithus albus]
MDPVCGVSPAQIGLFPGPMGLSPGQSWVVSGFPQAKYITFKGILGHSPGSRGILQEVFASGGGITKENGMGSLKASLMVVRVNAGYRSFPELRDHDRKSPQSLQDRHLETQHWQEMGLEILTVGDFPGWSNGVGDSPGGSWRFPRVVKWGWRFPREQLEIPQGAVGDFPGGSWRFPMVAKWVGDSPGGSKGVGGSPLGAILVNVAVSTSIV